MDETEALIGLCVRALAAQMIFAPGAELLLTATAVLGLTETPLADYNRLMIGAGPDAEAFLVQAVERAQARGAALSAVLSPEAARALWPLGAQLGFSAVGTAPLMVLGPETPVAPGGAFRVERALDPDQAAVAGDLIAAAFDEPRDIVARYLESGMTPTSGVETWIARDGDFPLGTVSVTPTGDAAGITLMATPPALQGRGVGRDLLSQVIGAYRRRGVTRFHLGSSDAGRRLYDRLGFRLVADLPVWARAAGNFR